MKILDSCPRFRKLPVFAFAMGLACVLGTVWRIQAQENETADQSSEAEQSQQASLLERSRKKLLNQPYRAKIHETITVGGRQVDAEGFFVQGPNLKMRMQIEFEAAGMKARLLQVCDGDIVNTEQQLDDEIRLTRRDVQQILNAATRSGAIGQNRIIVELGVGGVAGLLASLERNMVFTEPTEEVIDGERFQVLEGSWNEQYQAKFKANPLTAKQLPQHLPQKVRIYLDSTLFPRRIRYLKESGEDKILLPLVTLDFNDIAWLSADDLAQQAELFRYEAPEGIFPKEVTNQYIEMLRNGPSGQ
ncbi:hypothetical protein [Thalassoroseus pseudoceratinae]|uniref:hypothetical protein n=1 Tax=Thalassoroseus pseudoceratinae TaxID=2713176 RepID=UPI00142389C6|nr:hypothetical protein [Thalassoroseus pseudoceratinae]